MKQTIILASVLAMSSVPAFAGGQADALGVGAEFQMNGLTGGVSMNYDLGKMHVGGFVGFNDNGNDETDYTIGGRFFYHVHSRGQSDFSVGGQLGWYSDETVMGGNSNRDTLLFLEPSVQIRAFITPNVALSFDAGIIIALSDADGTVVTGGILGQGVTGGAGVHYYFF